MSTKDDYVDSTVELIREEIQAWWEQIQDPDSPVEPPDPPPTNPPPDDLEWPYFNGNGHFIDWWPDRRWLTSIPNKLTVEGNVYSMKQGSTTKTYLAELDPNPSVGILSGRVRFKMKLDQEFNTAPGGGKHLVQLTTSGSVGGRVPTLDGKFHSRIELANSSGNPRLLLWNYGPGFNGRPKAEDSLGHSLPSDTWIDCEFQWTIQDPNRLTCGLALGDDVIQVSAPMEIGTLWPLYFGPGFYEDAPGQSHWKDLVIG